MTSTFGGTVKFKIVEDLGIRDFLDTDFRFARIQLHTGEVTYASFDNQEYSLLKDPAAEMQARIGHQVFDAPPTATSGRFSPHSFGDPTTEKNRVLMLMVDSPYVQLGNHKEGSWYVAFDEGPGVELNATPYYADSTLCAAPERPSSMQRLVAAIRSTLHL